jgi:2-keto-myo-inositol isomerase
MESMMNANWNTTGNLSRRQWLVASGAAVGGMTVTSSTSAAGLAGSTAEIGNHENIKPQSDSKVRFCFNTACLRGPQIPIEQLATMVAKAGYDGIEVWIDELDRYTSSGKSLKDLGKQIADSGLKVESAIAFANWLVEDEKAADQEFEKAKRDMEKVAAIGGSAIAAPPVGQNDRPIKDWNFAAQRLARLGAVGREVGVVPQLELWGFSQAIGHVSQLLQLAALVETRDFGVLLDVYHLYKGGSPDNALRLVSGSQMALFHINDYPAMPDRTNIADKDRVFPGDGIAPLNQIFCDLESSGFQGALSLELFNPEYWQKSPAWVLATGLAKSKSAWESRRG